MHLGIFQKITRQTNTFKDDYSCLLRVIFLLSNSSAKLIFHQRIYPVSTFKVQHFWLSRDPVSFEGGSNLSVIGFMGWCAHMS